jgi:hypothetical protein
VTTATSTQTAFQESQITLGNWCLTHVAPGQYNFDECCAELVQVERNDEDLDRWELNEDGVTLHEGTRTEVEEYIRNSFVPEESLY